jgi:hypothetical protein
MADPRSPTRADLAKFLPDQRSIRAFEKLFELIPDELGKQIEDALIQAGTADARSQQAVDLLASIADSLETLVKAPMKEAEDQIRVSYIDFDMNPSVVEKNGRMWWNSAENCLNIAIGGSVLQVGFEQYLRAENDTGATITNGSVVGFAGVNGEIKISKYIADGSISSLYFIGVATQDFSNGEIGQVTTFGKVRGLNTSSWSTGTILYASPTTTGELTNIRPTAPNEVTVVAVVLVSDSTNGEIMVRPTIPIGLDYGSFSDTTIQTLAATSTAYPIKHNTTDISHGITVENDGGGNPTQLTVSQAGLYKVSVSNQYTSSNSSQKDVETWLRLNGVDIANTNSYQTIAHNGATIIFSTTYIVSMQAGDYLQVMWACATDTAVSINNIAATAYSPAAPSCITSIAQIQL